MKLNRFIFLPLIFLFACSTTSRKPTPSSPPIEVKSSPSPNKTSSSSQQFQKFRESASEYWTWLKTQTKTPEVKEILSFNALGVGDPHLLNFGFIETKNTLRPRFVGVIDYDDTSTRVPLFGDWLRYFTSVQLAGFSFNDEKIWQSYVSGLRGDDYSIPDFISEFEKKSVSEFWFRQKAYIEKYVSDQKFNAKASLVKIDDAPKEVKKTFKKIAGEFNKKLKDLKILDFGYYSKKSGGSRAQMRFWYLVQAKDRLAIVEFKQMTTPSPENYQNQGERRKNLKNSMSFFLQGETPRLHLDRVESGPNIFLMRERTPKWFDCDPEEKLKASEMAECSEYTYYVSHLLGKLHRLAHSGYARTILEKDNYYLYLTRGLSKVVP